MKTFRETLKDIYLDYVNDYLTSSKFAIDHELDVIDMVVLIEIGRRYHKEDTTT